MKNEVIEYVMNSPGNTNRAVLESILETTFGGGEGDHSMEDGLLMGTLEHYVNDRVTSIGTISYNGFSAFTHLRERLKSVSMEKVESIPYGCFDNFPALESANFPNAKSVETNAFWGASSLVSLNIPEVTSIGNYSLCADSLFIVDLPKVTSVGECAFAQYTTNHVLLRSTTMAVIADVNDGFEGYVYVPRSLVDSYKTAENWSYHANRIRALEDYTVDGTITGELDMSKI